MGWVGYVENEFSGADNRDPHSAKTLVVIRCVLVVDADWRQEAGLIAPRVSAVQVNIQQERGEQGIHVETPRE
jgi:hypothetical protein